MEFWNQSDVEILERADDFARRVAVAQLIKNHPEEFEELRKKFLKQKLNLDKGENGAE